MMTDKLGVYIHIPFCKKKCNYCDFVSGCYDHEMQKEYVNSLLFEIENNVYLKDSVVDTVFIGGGTPSIIDAKDIGRILNKLNECCKVETDAEISMESNPGTLTKEKLQAYKSFGINRLSMGLQSTDDEQLKVLGRIHTFDDFLRNFEDARMIGFSNINVDLMSAIPGQNVESFAKGLEKIKNLNPEHISIYSLIIEEGTPFYNMKLDVCDEDDEREMVHLIPEILGSEYSQYEISNYAKKGFECRHNIKYWKRDPYLGFGVAAASLVGENAPYNIRLKNTGNINDYVDSIKNIMRKDIYGDFEKFKNRDIDCFKIALESLYRIPNENGSIEKYGDFRIPLSEYEKLSKNEMMSEYMILSLRMNSGASGHKFTEMFDEDMYEIYKDAIEKHINEKLLLRDCDAIRLSVFGRDVCNYVLKDFM